jgi:hypothetical protein
MSAAGHKTRSRLPPTVNLPDRSSNNEERNHQGKNNRFLFPSRPEARKNMGAVRCRERVGGLLKYYEREAA